MRRRDRSSFRYGLGVIASGWIPVVAGFVGCSDPNAASRPIGQTFEVKGQVLLRTNKPLTEGKVIFVPEDVATVPASGEIGTNGQFTLSTRNPGDGAMPGRYRVRVEPTGGKSARGPRLPFPTKYVDEDSSGISVTVKPESNLLDPIKLN